MKKGSKINEHMPEALQNPRVRGLLFFGFYALFFLVIFLMFGNENQESKSNSNNLSSDPSYQISKINEANYHFRYEITENDQTTIFEGDKNQNKERFQMMKEDTVTNYFRDDDIFLIEQPTWQLTTSPYPYSKFLDAKEIYRLIKNSTFESKTEYSEGMNSYQYVISTTTLLSLLDDIDTDLMDEVNRITIYVQENEVNKIELELTPYLKYQDPNNQRLTISMEYTLFGSIEELNAPN